MLFDILSHLLCFSLYIYNFVFFLNHLYRCFRHLDTSHKHFSLYLLRISIFSQITQFHFIPKKFQINLNLYRIFPRLFHCYFMFSLPIQDLIKDRILPWLLTLQQSPFSPFYYMLSRKCLTAILYFHSLITLANLSPSG